MILSALLERKIDFESFLETSSVPHFSLNTNGAKKKCHLRKSG
ncbi:MAG: hypothetical protein ACJATF_004340 [Flavobacteriales bacterium]|jgi:hypothetical protein